MNYLGIRLTLKIAILSKLIYRFSTSRKKIVAGSFAEIDKPILKFLGKCKGPRIPKQWCERRRLRPLREATVWGLEVQVGVQRGWLWEATSSCRWPAGRRVSALGTLLRALIHL